MARGSEPKKVVGKRGGISWKMIVDIGEDPATGKRKQKKLTAATMMLEAGEPIKHVSEMLGHSSIAITGDTYSHVTPAGRKHAALTLGKALFGVGR